ncbi:hypothetical protein ABD91_20100 [Lysinibacillus sphaericus]|uniref:hypothetical protein n=1 Tax=Lysinibacillus sphaericus TaxID=1421 RepID=UPI0018CD2259|nr:hypothetical protein [Lysinibacillus sphaericus]MBG9693063.1 hypothetical protein [Lysinibacillus sphaericus]
MIQKLQEKAGYVSIETVVVASFMIVLGLYGLQELSSVASIVMDTAVEQLHAATEIITNLGAPKAPSTVGL